MSGLRFKGLTGAFVGVSLLISSTGAIASTNTAPIPQQVNPWAALAVMSGAQPAAVLCGSASASAAAAAAATAQVGVGCVLPAVDTPAPVPQAAAEPPAPIPVPPVELAGGGLGVSPLLLALAAVAAGVGLYFLLKGHDNTPTTPISPV